MLDPEVGFEPSLATETQQAFAVVAHIGEVERLWIGLPHDEVSAVQQQSKTLFTRQSGGFGLFACVISSSNETARRCPFSR